MQTIVQSGTLSNNIQNYSGDQELKADQGRRVKRVTAAPLDCLVQSDHVVCQVKSAQKDLEVKTDYLELDYLENVVTMEFPGMCDSLRNACTYLIK